MLYGSIGRELSTREVVLLAAIGVTVVGVLLTTAAVKRLLRRWG